MFYLHASNRTENLLQHMAALIEASPGGSLFEKEYILIQSQGMERMISQYMAIYFTSWCNYQFLLPVTFLECIAEKLDMEITPDSFERSALCWRIEEKLRDIGEDVYKPLQQYLVGSQAELKRFQLARQIANVFDQYQLMRPQMLRSWKHNKPVTSEPAELWQMHLWNRLLADDAGGKSRGELLRDIIATLHQPVTIADLPARVSIFGVHILPPIFLEYLQGLACHTDVHLFLLSPCSDYWGDLLRRKSISALDESQFTHHPLLLSLGQQGRDFQELLLEKVQFADEFISYEEPYDTRNPRLLHTLQSDLLAGRVQERTEDITADGSIRIISCHSRERELSVLKDHIIDLMEKNRELQLGDIVVMAPDIQEYAPLIPALFDDIQHSIADRSMARRNICISLFQQFLDLFSGRFGWTEVFDLLQKEQIYRQFQLNQPDLDKLRHWVISAGIRWGLSSRARRKNGFSFAENSWQTGLERLLMGVAIDTEETVASILPYRDVEGSEAVSLGGLCEFIHMLEHADEDFGKNRSVHDWSRLLLQYARLLIVDHESRDFLELITILQTLSDSAEFHNGTVTFEVIRRWYEQTSTQTKSTSGFLKGSLTFCSMLPMRSIPFQAICLIGLNYGEFPESDRQLTYDLMKLRPAIGDRSMRADDRYQFLEVLLAARKWLYMSYVGQSLQNNNKLPPSVVITELLETLESSYGVKDFTEHHPLHGFSSRYFSGESSLFSYNEEDYRVALALVSSRRQQERWWQGSVETVTEDIQLSELLWFYTNPQLYFLQHSLGISFREQDLSPEDSEMFAPSGLDQYAALQTMLEYALTNKEFSGLYHQLCEAGRWPLGTPGELQFAEKSREVLFFAEAVKEQNLGKALADVSVDCRVGPYRIIGTLRNRYERGIMLTRYAKMKGKDLLCAWLYYLLAEALGEPCSHTLLMMKDMKVIFRESHSSEPGLEDLVHLFIRGQNEPIKLLLEPGLEYCRQLHRNPENIALQKAGNVYKSIFENGYEASWQLLYKNLDVETVLDEDFVQLSELILMPLLRRCSNG